MKEWRLRMTTDHAVNPTEEREELNPQSLNALISVNTQLMTAMENILGTVESQQPMMIKTNDELADAITFQATILQGLNATLRGHELEVERIEREESFSTPLTISEAITKGAEMEQSLALQNERDHIDEAKQSLRIV